MQLKALNFWNGEVLSLESCNFFIHSIADLKKNKFKLAVASVILVLSDCYGLALKFRLL